MKLIIFGSTGSIGQQLVNQALAQGHRVTAFARDTSKVRIEHENLHIEQGDVMDPQEYFVVNVGDRVFFDFDRSDLRPDAIDQLNRQADFLNSNGSITVAIEGHADERGTREYNLALGDRRASSAKQYLESMGVSGGRMRTISYGKERPAVLGSNEDAWAQNRRAVTVIESGSMS